MRVRSLEADRDQLQELAFPFYQDTVAVKCTAALSPRAAVKLLLSPSRCFSPLTPQSTIVIVNIWKSHTLVIVTAEKNPTIVVIATVKSNCVRDSKFNEEVGRFCS